MRLSPPWITFHSLVNAVLSADPEVTVSPLHGGGSSYSMQVACTNAAKAQALAAVLLPSQQMGNITVQISVRGHEASTQPILSPAQVAEQIQTAFKGNPFYIRTEVRPLFPGRTDAAVYPILAAKVIQFWNDNLADFYGNYNSLAAEAFSQLLRPQGTTQLLCSTEKVG